MTVTLAKITPSASGQPTRAQRDAVVRFRERHPGRTVRLGKAGRLTGFAGLIVPSLPVASWPLLDAEGYVIGWSGEPWRGGVLPVGAGEWVRLGSPIDPSEKGS